MLFHVRMDVHIPYGADSKHVDKLRSDEKARAQQLQRDGTWRHLWRIVGEYANISIFDVESSDKLHEISDVASAFSLHANQSNTSLSPSIRDRFG